MLGIHRSTCVILRGSKNLKLFFGILLLGFFIRCEHFFDFSPPEVRFISPQDGQTVYLSTQIEIEVKDKNLETVELYVDGRKLKTYDSVQISNDRIIDTLEISEGPHTLSAKAYDRGGNFNECEISIFVSEVAVPTLISPANGDTLLTNTLSFDWDDLGAVKYWLQVDNNSDFSSPEINDSTITSSSYTATTSLTDARYYWRVKAQISVGLWGDWSNVWNFYVFVPYEVGYYDTPDFALGVFVSGSYAYVADGYAGLRIIDVSNPSSPYEAGYYDTPDFARGVFVSGSYAYVADNEAGLRIINVSNPSSPYETGYYDTPSLAYGVYVSGSYAYVADGYAGLRIINVSNPSSPYETGYYEPTLCDASVVFVSGSYAYVADWDAGLRIINVSNPSSPYEAGYYGTPNWARGVYVSGSYAYVAAGGSGLRIIDVSNPSSPYEAGYYDTPNEARGVYVSGSYAYVADGYAGLRIIRIKP